MWPQKNISCCQHCFFLPLTLVLSSGSHPALVFQTLVWIPPTQLLLFFKPFSVYPRSLLSPTPLVRCVQTLATCRWMEWEQTGWAVPRCLPLIPTTHAHPVPPARPSVQVPAAFPLNAARPWPAAQKIVMDLDPRNEGGGMILMGKQSTMSDAHTVPVHSTVRLCDGTNPLPLALQH